MRGRFSIISSLCVALLVSAVRGAIADDKPDASTPKAAALLFSQAMDRGDVAAARSLATGAAKQLAVLDVLVPVAGGFKKLELAAKAKWGDEGRKTLFSDEGPGRYDFAKRLETSTEEIAGDTATIRPADAKDAKRDTLKMKRVGGQWKVDMMSIPTEGLDNPTTMKTLKTMAETATTLASEIEQGKFASAAAARDALRQRMLEDK